MPGIARARSGGTGRTPGRRSAAPARQAAATPSPVATAGLVVCEYSCPAPPVASMHGVRRRGRASCAVPSSSSSTPTHRGRRSSSEVGAAKRVLDARVIGRRARTARRRARARSRRRSRRRRRAGPGRASAPPRARGASAAARRGRTATPKPMQFADARRALVAEHLARPRRRSSPAPAAQGVARCALRRGRRGSSAGGDAALGVAVLLSASSPLVTRVTVPAGARTAARPPSRCDHQAGDRRVPTHGTGPSGRHRRCHGACRQHPLEGDAGRRGDVGSAPVMRLTTSPRTSPSSTQAR